MLTCAKEDSQDPGTTPSNIVPKYTLTASAGDGGSVSSEGGSYNKGTQVSITATASEGYRFTGWSNGSSDNPVTVTLNSNTSITANFEQIPVYSISVSAEEGGSVSSQGGEYSEGTQVSITATADEGYEFSGWSDGNTEATRVITASEDLTLTATFTELEYSYQLTVTSTEGGSISSEGGEYNEGTEVSITATADEGYRFIGWSDGNTEESITITITEDTSIEAVFELIPIYTVTVTSTEGGSISSEGGDYQEGTEITITATADEGYEFTGWSDGSTGESITINIIQDTSIEAVFELIPVYTLTVSAGEGGSVSPDSGEYQEGTELTVTATPNQGYRFVRWTNHSPADENPFTIVMNVNLNFEAFFELVDADGDGVPDYLDQCPNTYEAEQVGENGCLDPYSFSGLPIININTSGVSIDSKEDYVDGDIIISGINNFSDLPKTQIKIKGRGNSTWWLGSVFGKKPYQIRFDEKTEVLNMPEDIKWVLLSEFADGSLIRNKLAREIAKIGSFDYVPQAEYVELFLNGQHQGTYLIGQKVEESVNRVNIGDEGYLLEIDTYGRFDNDEVYFDSSQREKWNEFSSFNKAFIIKDPEIEYNSEKFNLIKNYVDSFEDALFSEDFKNPESGYRAYIDLESFIDYYLVSEISKNQDASAYETTSSIYFSYVPGEKIKMGPIWDYDLGFGNVDYSPAKFPEGFWIKTGNPWYKRMFEDEYFEQVVRDRFNNYYYGNLANIQSKIDEFESYLSTSQEKNFELYPEILDPNVYVWPIPVRFYNYYEYVDHLKAWLNERWEWLSGYFED